MNKKDFKKCFSLFDNLPYRVYVRDKNKKIVFVNKMVEDLLKVDNKDIIDKKYENIFHDERFIFHLNKHDELIFSKEIDFITTIHKYNKYYDKEAIFKVIDYLYENEEQEEYIVTMLIEINDSYKDKNYLLKLSDIGKYDPINGFVYLADITLSLTKTENDFLFLLCEKQGDIVGYDEIFLAIDPGNKMTKESLKTLVYRLRKKLNTKKIKSVPNCGYKIFKNNCKNTLM